MFSFELTYRFFDKSISVKTIFDAVKGFCKGVVDVSLDNVGNLIMSFKTKSKNPNNYLASVVADIKKSFPDSMLLAVKD